MNLLQVFMVFLIFNIVAGMITYANIFGIEPDVHYETSYTDITNNPSVTNISTYPSAESEQYVKTWNVFSILYNSLTFNWIYSYVPWEFRDNTIVVLFINGINAILLIIGIATFWQIVRRVSFLGS